MGLLVEGKEAIASGSRGEAGSGWRAKLNLGYELRKTRSTLTERIHYGPLTVQRPFYPEGDAVCHTYLLHPPAGIVGGDSLELNLRVGRGAHALLTTPGANRWYNSPRCWANVQQRATVEDDAILEWLPQETILFNGARARLKTRIELIGGARFWGWEILGLGRPACDEPFSKGAIDFRFEIYRDGEPLMIERLLSHRGELPGVLGYSTCATLSVTGADEKGLERARELIKNIPEGIAGATLVKDVLIVRVLASTCEAVMSVFIQLWEALREPLIGRPVEHPRIWYT